MTISDFPVVTILIPCRNELKFIEGTINKILSSDYPSDKIEIIVADGCSNDGTYEKLLEIEKAHKQVRVIKNERKFTPIAFNLGLQHGHGEYFMTLGARQVMEPNYLRECISVLMNNEDIVCCGGIIVSIPSNEKGAHIAKAMSSSIGVGMGNFRSITESKYVDTVGAPIYKRWVFEKIGWFDEELVRNQDDELNYRVSQAGYKIYLIKDAHTSYYVRESFKLLYKQYFQYGYWKVYVNKKHNRITTLRQIFPALFILSLFGTLLLSALYIKSIYLFLIILGSYLLLITFFITKMSSSLKEAKNIFIAVLCLHFGYGFGYIKGIWDFLILNRTPAKKATLLTR